MNLFKNYSPSRILGALNRRRADLFRGFAYRGFKKLLLQEAVLFESFQGKVIGDSPLDIFHEVKRQHPGLKLFFTNQPSKTEAPVGAIGLVHGSREWLKALATSKYLVNNTNFPPYFTKRSEQIYLQTWHGTPLKRLGHDIEDAAPLPVYLNMMDREALSWNYLISPNNFCTQIFPKAFKYGGEILETGYPRNDRLVTNPKEVREKVRRQLGVDMQTKLVLYAPTWRDYKRTATGNWQTVNFIDSSTVMPEGFRLAFRGHTNTHAAHSAAVAGDAIDVTNYPDVTELYLAADILITDYSSVMFDFTVTGKPVLFLAPDIQEYESKRGFYFDFVAEAPGPICKNVGEVIGALKNLNQVSENYSAKYKDWQQKFNSLEDGAAAKRVVQRVFA